MVGLLDGGLAAIFGAAFGGLYLDAVLHRRVQPTLDAGGSATGGAWVDAPCKAQLEAVTWAMQQSDGYTETDQRILVLSASLGVVPTTDDEITVGGQRWAIETVTQDPAVTVWDIRGRRA